VLLLTPFEWHEELEEETKGSMVEDEEVDGPFDEEADEFHQRVDFPENLHHEHGKPLLPCLFEQVAREGGVDSRRMAVLKNTRNAVPCALGLSCHERRRRGLRLHSWFTWRAFQWCREVSISCGLWVCYCLRHFVTISSKLKVVTPVPDSENKTNGNIRNY